MKITRSPTLDKVGRASEPDVYGVVLPIAVGLGYNESARGLAQSKTLARDSTALKNGEAFGLRQSSGALGTAHPTRQSRKVLG